MKTRRTTIDFFFFSSRRRHTRSLCDWSSDVCSSDLAITRRDVRVADVVEWCPDAQEPIGRDELAVLRELHSVSRGSDSERSEERRVGKECRCRWWPDEEKKKKKR